MGHTGAEGIRITRLAVGVALSALAVLAFGALIAERAAAQDAAICDQYPGLPQCDQANGGSGGDQGPIGGDEGLTGGDQSPSAGSTVNGIPGAGGPTAAIAGSAKGELPFTGYPLTPAILIFLLLLIAGLTIRASLAIRDRVRARSGPSAPA